MSQLERTYGEENVTNFVTELERVEQALDPAPEAIARADKLAQQWGLHSYERRLLAVELDFFDIRPQEYSRTGPSYAQRYMQGGEHLVFRSGEGFAEAGWRLRIGATIENLQQALSPGYFAHTEALLEAVAHNIQGLVFNVAHEEVLSAFGYCARQALYARKQG